MLEPNHYKTLGQQIEEYCRKYSIPLEYFIEIIKDEEVVQLLRIESAKRNTKKRHPGSLKKRKNA